MQETKEWLKAAENDLKVAQHSLKSGFIEWSIFQAQQAAEKSLKALHIKTRKHLLKTHDIVFLSRKLNAPKKIIDYARIIAPAYIDTRYPDLAKKYSEKDAKQIILLAFEILTWSKKNSSKN